MDINTSRRNFLIGSAVGTAGLMIYFNFPGAAEAAEAAADGSVVNSWLRISSDNTITMLVPRCEMGQGIYTSLPMVVAEELEADWKSIKIEMAQTVQPYDKLGALTGASSSIRANYANLRKIGAAAKEMLITAAATEWGLKPEDCYAKAGMVLNKKNDKKLAYGKLAAAAGALKVPDAPKLKPEAEFTIIGKATPRFDVPSKVNGTAMYTIDMQVPGMMMATVRLAPVFGGDVSNLEALKSNAPKGVTFVAIPNGVAAVASNYWTANRALEKADIKFSPGPNAKLTSEFVHENIKEVLAGGGGFGLQGAGNVKQKFGEGSKKVEATFEIPYATQMAMEPMSCVASVQGDKCEIWAASQAPFRSRTNAAKTLGIPEANVKFNNLLAGGAFGRRLEHDFVVQAVLISKAVGKPIKLVWSREEDVQHSFYRPACGAKMEGVLDASGNLVSFSATYAGSWPMQRVAPAKAAADGHDVFVSEGGKAFYGIPNISIRTIQSRPYIPVGYLRAVGATHNPFYIESFIDQLAHTAGKDPVEFRRTLLKDKPRHLAVLEAVVAKVQWNKSMPANTALGFAMSESQGGTIVAEVAEVEVSGKEVRVKRVVCGYDCGQVVNPSTVREQMEGSIVYGLTLALKSEITIQDGRVMQSNFHDYPILTMAETPSIEVFQVKSANPPGGVGEPGVGPIAPAVANAIFKATGKRMNGTPFAKYLG